MTQQGRVPPKKRDSGSDANETIDGLNSNEEATRKGAEDTPLGSKVDVEKIPVFERGDLPPSD